MKTQRSDVGLRNLQFGDGLKAVLHDIREEGFTRILVTGPQRSGTGIAARILAEELELRHVDEADFGTYDVFRLVAGLRFTDRIVVQGPAMAYCCHALAKQIPGLLVVFMFRDIPDIVASEKRVGWDVFPAGRPVEVAQYASRYSRIIGPNTPIAGVKYAVWEYQRRYVPDYVELPYDYLKDHPLFIPKERRTGFTIKQWKLP